MVEEKKPIGFKKSLKRTLKNFGSATGKVFNSIDEAEKKIMEKSKIKGLEGL
jgi:hypothetical protein